MASDFRNEPAIPQEERNSHGDAFDIHFRTAVWVPGGDSGHGLLIRGADLCPAKRHDDADRPPRSAECDREWYRPAPQRKAQESWHSQYGSKFARNVTVATIPPFLPDPARACGAAVVVAPGGGFRTLSMENEGRNVARALAERGVAAFVLDYRLDQTPADMPGLERSMKEVFSSTARPRPASLPDPHKMLAGLAPQLEDARTEFALIRHRAAEWKLDTNRIGMGALSAGAMLTLATELAGQDAKPAFIGIIYGPLAQVTVSADAPPLFVALAADDPVFANGGFGLIDRWRTARKPAEFHL